MRAMGRGSIAAVPVGYGLWVPSGQHRSYLPARALPHRAPPRQRRDGGRVGGARRAPRTLRRGQGPRLAPVRGRARTAALRARGARRRGPLDAPARRDDLRRRRARRPRVHGDGADARRHGRASGLKGGRAIADETALRWLREAAGALDAAHEAGVVHRDIKPGNLLLDDRDRLAIADFGIARVATEDQLTATGQVLGTAAYISPEQAVGEPATAASDRYALAVVAFELLTGAQPFQAEHFAAQARAHVEDPPPLATERDASLPVSVDAVLERGLAKDPGERWESARDMVAALDRAMGSSRPPTEPTRAIAAPPAHGGGPPATSGDRGGWPLLWLGLAARVVAAVAGSCCSRAATAAARTRASQRGHPAADRAEQEGHADADAHGRANGGADRDRHAGAHRRPRKRPPGRIWTARANSRSRASTRAGQATTRRRSRSTSRRSTHAATRSSSNPCGFALFEIGAALNALGRPDEAIALLEQRLELYGDNSAGEVKDELKKARKRWKGRRLSSPGWRPRWPASRSCRPSRGASCTTTSALPAARRARARHRPRRRRRVHRGGGSRRRTADHGRLRGRGLRPAAGGVLAPRGRAGRVEIVREFSSYTWWLKEQVQARSDAHGNVEPRFDFVYLDGAKNWTIDGLAVVLVEKLLRPGGWLLMDDLDWTYADDPGREATDGDRPPRAVGDRAHRAAPARRVRADRRPAPVVHRAARCRTSGGAGRARRRGSRAGSRSRRSRPLGALAAGAARRAVRRVRARRRRE